MPSPFVGTNLLSISRNNNPFSMSDKRILVIVGGGAGVHWTNPYLAHVIFQLCHALRFIPPLSHCIFPSTTHIYVARNLIHISYLFNLGGFIRIFYYTYYPPISIIGYQFQYPLYPHPRLST